MAEQKKAKFRDGLKEFYQDHFGEKEQKLNDHQRSKGFGLFYLTEVLAKLNPGLIPENLDDIEACFVDGKDDQGVDFLISQENHHTLVQCKYRGKAKIEDEKEVQSFKGVFGRIHPVVGQNFKKNDRLADALAGIDWKNDTFLLIFVSLGRDTDDIRTYERKDFSEINHPDLKDIKYRAEFRFFSEEDLNKEYRDTLKSKRLVEVEIRAQKDNRGNYWYCYKNENGLRSYITTLDAAQAYELYKRNREALFNLNIRNFIGDTSTNKGIIETAEGEPENFFFYNNGVSAVASEVTASEKKGILSCKDFSIINGAQSIRSVHRVYQRLEGQSKVDIENLAIMLRVTETPNLFKSPEFTEGITRYNNTQNAVRVSDFRSNDGVQNSLHSYFGRKSYLGKKYVYKNKRTKETPSNSIAINLDDFCKILHSFLKGPVDFFGGIKYLYDTAPSGGYYHLFGDEESNSIVDALSKEKFEECAAIFFICESARNVFKDQKKEIEAMEKQMLSEGNDDNQPLMSQRALQGRYLYFYVLGLAFNALAKKSGNLKKEEFLVRKGFNNPNWREDEKKNELIEKLVSLACSELVSDYSHSYDRPGFVHREWFRDRETLKRLEKSMIGKYSQLRDIYESYFAR